MDFAPGKIFALRSVCEIAVVNPFLAPTPPPFMRPFEFLCKIPLILSESVAVAFIPRIFGEDYDYLGLIDLLSCSFFTSFLVSLPMTKL